MPNSVGFLFIITFSYFITGLYNIIMPSIATSFGASTNDIQSTFSIYFVGNVASGILCALFADFFGKKNILYAGLGLSFLGALMCLVSYNVEILYYGRLIQGLGTIVGMMIGIAAVADLYSQERATKIFGYMTISIMVSNLVSPNVAGFLTSFVHWRSTFVMQCLVAAFAIYTVYVVAPDSLNDRQGDSFKRNLKSLKQIFSSRDFIAPALLNPILVCGLFFMNAIFPFYFQTTHGYEPYEIGLYTSISVIGLGLGGALNNYLSRRMEGENILTYSLICAPVSPLFLLATHFLAPSSLAWATVASFMYSLLIGTILPNSIALALSSFPLQTAKTSSIRAIFIFAAMFVGSSLAALSMTNNLLIVALFHMLCITTALAVHHFVRRRV